MRPDGDEERPRSIRSSPPAIISRPFEDVVSEGGKVLVRLRVQGTHDGNLLGIPATGRPIDIAVLDLFRIENGRLVEHRALLDNLGLLREVCAVLV